MTKKPIWERSISCKPKEQGISNQFPTKKFHASYEKQEVNVKWLLANEYQRVWVKEKHEWDKLMYPSKENPGDVKRKGVLKILSFREREQENLTRLERWKHTKGRVIPFRSQPPFEDDLESVEEVDET